VASQLKELSVNAIKAINWQTQKLVDVMTTLDLGVTSYARLAELCEVDVDAVKRRLTVARSIVLRDHHVIIDTVRGVGVVRLAQSEVTTPVERQRNRARSAARKGRKLIADGVTDWDTLDSVTKTQLWTESAVLGAIVQATDHHSRKRIQAQVEVANEQLNIGRTMELLK
jgi:hypothetical protein